MIELYATDAREPNAEVSALFATVGGQLGSYLARRRGARAPGAVRRRRGARRRARRGGRVEIANGTACAALGAGRARAARARLVRVTVAERRATPPARGPTPACSRASGDGFRRRPACAGAGRRRATPTAPALPAPLRRLVANACTDHCVDRARTRSLRRSRWPPPRRLRLRRAPRPPRRGSEQLATLTSPSTPTATRQRRAAELRAELQGADRQRGVRRRRRHLGRRPRADAGRHRLHADLRRPGDGHDQGHDPRQGRRRELLAHRRLRDRALGQGQAAARRGAVSYRVTVRRGPKVEHDEYETLDQALGRASRTPARHPHAAAMEALGRTLRARRPGRGADRAQGPERRGRDRRARRRLARRLDGPDRRAAIEPRPARAPRGAATPLRQSVSVDP